MALGILVHGGNHLILRGPRPSLECARRLADAFALGLVQLGEPPRAEFAQWQIRTREWREHLTWAVHLHAAEAPSPAVRVLLDELGARGVAVHRENETWEGAACDEGF